MRLWRRRKPPQERLVEALLGALERDLQQTVPEKASVRVVGVRAEYEDPHSPYIGMVQDDNDPRVFRAVTEIVPSGPITMRYNVDLLVTAPRKK